MDTESLIAVYSSIGMPIRTLIRMTSRFQGTTIQRKNCMKKKNNEKSRIVELADKAMATLIGGRQGFVAPLLTPPDDDNPI
jgi:hypothetical protein